LPAPAPIDHDLAAFRGFAPVFMIHGLLFGSLGPRGRRLCAAAAALFAVVACGAAAGDPLPGIVGGDDRLVVEPREFPWSAIGRLNTRAGGRCTATLVADRVAVTAAHCLYNRRTRRWLAPGSLHFLAGYDRGTHVAEARVVAVARGGGDRPPGRASDDWAVLTLDRPLAARVGTIALRALDAAALGRLIADGAGFGRGGYGQDRPHLPMADLGCPVIGLAGSGAVLAHRCDAVRGDSGSPVLLADGDTLSVIAVHVGHTSRDGATVGLAVAAAAFAAAAGDTRTRAPTGGAVRPVPATTVRALGGVADGAPTLAALARIMRERGRR